MKLSDETVSNPQPPVNEIAERIVAGARTCFERFGIQRATIGDIATAAGVSRPTVYKHFPSKQTIIDRISIIEIGKIHEELRHRRIPHANFADNLTEALTVSVLVARENSYIDWFIRDAELRTRSQTPSGPLAAANLARWEPLLSAAIASGEIAGDLNIEDMVFWLTLSQSSLVLRMDATPIDEPQLRYYIRRFVVEPLLCHRAAEPASSDAPVRTPGSRGKSS